MSNRQSKQYVPTAKLLHEGERQHREGDYSDACRSFDCILQREPKHAAALWGKGRALFRLKQPAQAVPLLEQAAEIKPEIPEYRFDLALTYLAARRPADAVVSLRMAIKLQPNWVEAWSSLGYALDQSSQPEEAESVLRHALTLKPDHPEVLNHLGIVLMKQRGRIDEAIKHYLHAIAIRPGFGDALNNLAFALKMQNKLDESLRVYQQALASDPKYSKVKFNLSLVQLLKGELNRDTWLRYEYRWVVIEENPHRGFTQPIWRGDVPLKGKTILLHAEQGLGDTLQFVRYAPFIAAQGATVHLEVQPTLKGLLTGFPGTTSVIGRGEPLPPFDLQCPLLSLPLAMDTTLRNIPALTPYVHAPADRIQKWSECIPASADQPRIGVVWRGNPKHKNDANRSVGFETFRRLFDQEVCKFISLQLGLNDTEAATFADHPACRVPAGKIGDFTDTAAIVAQLDLVITVDTSVAHLAGAMGKPTWVLLPFDPDWRWLMQRTDSPWYPNVRLFRQPKIGDWDSVIAEVGVQLRRQFSRTPVISPAPLQGG
jgi:Flp pilus assembly protein TadD